MPPAALSPKLTAGLEVAGRYRLSNPLGSGGMGEVWRARQTQLDREVAIKFIRPGALSDGPERFETEAKAAARLEGENVVQILDYGRDGDLTYLAMELLDGEDLEARLRREGALPLDQVLELARQMGRGLHCVHEASVVHRDVKPGNVFMADVAGREVVKLLDFGIAKDQSAASSTTETGIVMGSPRYMSPEQTRSTRRADHRSDLWSFAVILFRAATGCELFHGETVADVVIKVCTEPMPTATSLHPDLPKRLDRFFQKALQRDPERRFQTASELVSAFEEALGITDSQKAQLEIGPVGRGADGSVEEEPTWEDTSPPSMASPGVSSNTLTATHTRPTHAISTRSVLWLGAAALGATAATAAVLNPWRTDGREAPSVADAEVAPALSQSTDDEDTVAETDGDSEAAPPAPTASASSSVAPTIAPPGPARPMPRSAPAPVPAQPAEATPPSVEPAPPQPDAPPPDPPKPPQKMQWGI